MTTYKDYFLQIINFLKAYESFIDCHLVDFLTEDLWEKYLPKNLKPYFEENISTAISNIEQVEEPRTSNDTELDIFLKDVRSLKLENNNNIISRSDFLNILDYKKTESLKPNQSEFMKVKKWHEVNIFTKTIVWLTQDESSIVIDAGAGKGYSSLYLSNYYSLPVLAIESSQINHKGAILHRDLVNKKNKKSTSLINYAVEFINESTDFVQMVKNHFPELYLQKQLIITALHACGSLTDSVIKSFLNISDIKCLCIVPCCYHLETKSLLGVYEFSKNARMLAQQSTDRLKQKNEPLSQSLFYRAVLQVILRSVGIDDAKIGRGAPLNNFLIYAKWALKKVDSTKAPSDEMLEKTYKKYEDQKWKFQAFQLLRIQLAPIIEAAIILDKLLFIQKSKLCTKLEAVQLFDPILSPRNWAIIATK